MSLFGSLMADVEDDPFFGSHMRHMRQMNNMMNSLFSDPFGMLGGGGPLAIGGPRHGSSLMPFMPQMPSLNRLFSGDLDGMGTGSSFSSSTVVMSSGPGGNPQVYSSTSSTKIGPNGVKETRKTLQDSRTGTKKMSIGHHIGERAHVIEREQNLYSGDAEERQEFINIDEEEAEDFDREFQVKAGAMPRGGRGDRALPPAPPARRDPPRLALPPAPSTNGSTSTTKHSSEPRDRSILDKYSTDVRERSSNDRYSSDIRERTSTDRSSYGSDSRARVRPTPRRPLRTTASPLTTSTMVREVYGGSHPQRHRNKQHKTHRPAEN